MTTISVAMATFNGSPFLKAQLDSIVSQSFQPTELVVCDDCSSDDTISIIETYARAAPFPIKLIRNTERLGYRANFIKAASYCTSDLISFSDQDDLWNPRKLELQSIVFEEPRIYLAAHSVTVVDRTGRPTGREYKQFPRSLQYDYLSARPFAFAQGFTLMFRRSLLSFLKYWEMSIDHHSQTEKMAHDVWFCFLALTLGSMYYDTRILALYRQHGNNVSGDRLPTQTLMNRLKQLLYADRGSEYDLLAASARNRLQIIVKIANDLISRDLDFYKPSLDARLRLAANQYTSLCAMLERRATLYKSTTMRSRFASIVSSIVAGDYRIANSWRYSIFGLLRDVIHAFFIPPVRIEKLS